MGVTLLVVKVALAENALQDIQKATAPAAMEEHGKGHVIITAIGEAGSAREEAVDGHVVTPARQIANAAQANAEIMFVLEAVMVAGTMEVVMTIIPKVSIPLLNAPVRLDRPNAPASLINPAQTANGQMQEPIATGMV